MVPELARQPFVMPIVSDHQLTNITGLEFTMGGAGSAGLIHRDGLQTETFIVQIHGRQEWVLFSPDQAPCLYRGRRCRRSRSWG